MEEWISLSTLCSSTDLTSLDKDFSSVIDVRFALSGVGVRGWSAIEEAVKPKKKVGWFLFPVIALLSGSGGLIIRHGR